MILVLGSSCQLNLVSFKIICNLNLGFGTIKRKIISGTKPEVEISIDGHKYTIVSKTNLKGITISFTLGEKYEADLGTGETKTVTKNIMVDLYEIIQ